MVGDLKWTRGSQVIPVAQQNEQFELAAVQHHTALDYALADGKPGRLYITTVMHGSGQPRCALRLRTLVGSREAQ